MAVNTSISCNIIGHLTCSELTTITELDIRKTPHNVIVYFNILCFYRLRQLYIWLKSKLWVPFCLIKRHFWHHTFVSKINVCKLYFVSRWILSELKLTVTTVSSYLYGKTWVFQLRSGSNPKSTLFKQSYTKVNLNKVPPLIQFSNIPSE